MQPSVIEHEKLRYIKKDFYKDSIGQMIYLSFPPLLLLLVVNYLYN